MNQARLERFSRHLELERQMLRRELLTHRRRLREIEAHTDQDRHLLSDLSNSITKGGSATGHPMSGPRTVRWREVITRAVEGVREGVARQLLHRERGERVERAMNVLNQRLSRLTDHHNLHLRNESALASQGGNEELVHGAAVTRREVGKDSDGRSDECLGSDGGGVVGNSTFGFAPSFRLHEPERAQNLPKREAQDLLSRFGSAEQPHTWSNGGERGLSVRIVDAGGTPVEVAVSQDRKEHLRVAIHGAPSRVTRLSGQRIHRRLTNNGWVVDRLTTESTSKTNE